MESPTGLPVESVICEWTPWRCLVHRLVRLGAADRRKGWTREPLSLPSQEE